MRIIFYFKINDTLGTHIPLWKSMKRYIFFYYYYVFWFDCACVKLLGSLLLFICDHMLKCVLLFCRFVVELMKMLWEPVQNLSLLQLMKCFQMMLHCSLLVSASSHWIQKQLSFVVIHLCSIYLIY